MKLPKHRQQYRPATNAIQQIPQGAYFVADLKDGVHSRNPRSSTVGTGSFLLLFPGKYEFIRLLADISCFKAYTGSSQKAGMALNAERLADMNSSRPANAEHPVTTLI
jgi:hypothetical protein